VSLSNLEMDLIAMIRPCGTVFMGYKGNISKNKVYYFLNDFYLIGLGDCLKELRQLLDLFFVYNPKDYLDA
jgi:hypothetical protein